MSKGNSAPKIPKSPNLGNAYQQGVDVSLQNLPQQLQTEQATRQWVDPARIQQQQDLQKAYGPRQYQQQLGALNQLDPQFMGVRNALGASVQQGLAAGSSLTPEQTQQMQQNVRGSQAARGNIYGAASGDAEAYALGDKGQQLLQSRQQAANQFLQSPSAVNESNLIAPVSADRSYGYVNPNAGYQGAQYAQQNYANQIGAAGVQAAGQNNPWGSILGGVAAAASIYGNSGYSDRRLKKNIKNVGTEYKGPRYNGVMADDVAKKVPGAVSIDPASGMKMVDYGKLGMKMRRVN